MTGSNYNSSLTTKEIAQRVREYVKKNFPGYKFSVRSSYNSIDVEMKSAPVKVYKTTDEMTTAEVLDAAENAYRCSAWSLDSYTVAEARAELEKLYNGRWIRRVMNDEVAATVAAVDKYVNSYVRDDSNPWTDYFDVNFYYSRCAIA